MINKIKTFFMFDGQAEEAINFYISLFKNSEIIDISYYTADEMGVEGTVRHATFSLQGQHFMAIDSYVPHDFTFTPSMSIFVDCDTSDEINSLFAKLALQGTILMPLDNYYFSSKFAWVTDSFGVSWQLNLK
jgi:predicted 3-demethylubiquinone-9 3-methyltransferase (glyoxalase superfamily)